MFLMGFQIAVYMIMTIFKEGTASVDFKQIDINLDDPKFDLTCFSPETGDTDTPKPVSPKWWPLESMYLLLQIMAWVTWVYLCEFVWRVVLGMFNYMISIRRSIWVKYTKWSDEKYYRFPPKILTSSGLVMFSSCHLAPWWLAACGCCCISSSPPAGLSSQRSRGKLDFGSFMLLLHAQPRLGKTGSLSGIPPLRAGFCQNDSRPWKRWFGFS